MGRLKIGLAQFGNEDKKAVLLFDGVCNSCNFIVNFLLKHDKEELFLFAPLQSPVGLKLLQQYDLSLGNLDTLVLVFRGNAYTYSSAVFQVVKLQGFPWSLLRIFSFLPSFITDFVYRSYASNRYRLFGKKDVCRIPSSKERNRFLTENETLYESK